MILTLEQGQKLELAAQNHLTPLWTHIEKVWMCAMNLQFFSIFSYNTVSSENIPHLPWMARYSVVQHGKVPRSIGGSQTPETHSLQSKLQIFDPDIHKDLPAILQLLKVHCLCHCGSTSSWHSSCRDPPHNTSIQEKAQKSLFLTPKHHSCSNYPKMGLPTQIIRSW